MPTHFFFPLHTRSELEDEQGGLGRAVLHLTGTPIASHSERTAILLQSLLKDEKGPTVHLRALISCAGGGGEMCWHLVLKQQMTFFLFFFFWLSSVLI